MQTRTYAGAFVDRNPDFSGVSWASYGATASHSDSDDTTGYQAGDPAGGESLAHAMVLDDGAIPARAVIRAVKVHYTLGESFLIAQGILPVVPYVRYEDGAPVFQERIQAPYVDSFAEYVVEFPRDPDGLPWTRAAIYRKNGKLLLFGLYSTPADLLTAEVLWSECRFSVDFDLPLPIVVTDPASLISAYAAQLNGRFNPRSANPYYPVTYWFEWGLTEDYGNQTVPVTGITGDLDLTVTALISELPVDVGHHFRLVVQTPDDTYYGGDQFFTTDPSATGRFRLDEFKRLATGEWLPGDRTRITSPGFDRPSTATDDLSCPFLEFP